MKKIYFILILLILYPSFINAQIDKNTYSKIGLNIKTGYYIPSKESFRKNYEQYLVFGNSKIPLSLGIGIDYFLSDKFAVSAEFSRIQNKINSNPDISLSLMPVQVGLKYYFNNKFIRFSSLNPYLGAAIGYYWARFSIKKLPWSIEDGTMVGELEESINYFGFGVNLKGGFNFKLTSLIILGFEIGYDINKVGDVEKGGLGNTGGFLFSIYSSIRL